MLGTARTSSPLMPEETPTACCQVFVAARISQSLASALHERFTHVCVTSDGKGLVVKGLDQAAVRALVNTLWDAGLDVCTVAVDPLYTHRPSFADEVTPGLRRDVTS